MPEWETRMGKKQQPSEEIILDEKVRDELTIEKGVVMFLRKPAKMGEDRVIWIPRIYVRNGLVDPSSVYDIFLRRVPKEEP